MFYIAADVETTGFDPIRNDIISIGISIANDDFKIIDSFYDCVHAPVNKFWSDDAEKIHGFSKLDNEGFKKPIVVARRILKFLEPYERKAPEQNQFCFHAYRGFDYNFIDWFFIKLDLQFEFYKFVNYRKRISTIDVAKKHRAITGLNSNKLDVVAKYVGFDLKHHNALSDCNAVIAILRYFDQLESM